MRVLYFQGIVVGFSVVDKCEHLVVGWTISVVAGTCTVLLCLFVRRLFMCWFVLHDKRCRHVSFSEVGIGCIIGRCLV